MPASSHLRLVDAAFGHPYTGRAEDIFIDLLPVDDDALPPLLARRRDLTAVGDIWLAGRSDHWIAVDDAGQAFAVDDRGDCIPLAQPDISAAMKKAVVAAARTAWTDEWARNLAELVQANLAGTGSACRPALDTIPAKALKTLAEKAAAARSDGYPRP